MEFISIIPKLSIKEHKKLANLILLSTQEELLGGKYTKKLNRFRNTMYNKYGKDSK